MKIGVRLPASGTNVSLDRLTTVARWAEELGYQGQRVRREDRSGAGFNLRAAKEQIFQSSDSMTAKEHFVETFAVRSLF